MPRLTARKVLDWYEFQWNAHRGYDEYAMLRALPAVLRVDILLHSVGSMVTAVPFFADCEEGFVPSLVARLAVPVAWGSTSCAERWLSDLHPAAWWWWWARARRQRDAPACVGSTPFTACCALRRSWRDLLGPLSARAKDLLER